MSLICNTCKREIVTYYSYGMTKQDLKDTDADIRNCGKIPLLDAAPFVPFICPSCNNSLTLIQEIYCPILDIPDNTLGKITNFLPIQDITSCMFVCIQWVNTMGDIRAEREASMFKRAARPQKSRKGKTMLGSRISVAKSKKKDNGWKSVTPRNKKKDIIIEEDQMLILLDDVQDRKQKPKIGKEKKKKNLKRRISENLSKGSSIRASKKKSKKALNANVN
eukprot:TRINITY_DN7487_c2_g1_i2.p1 TRINITY_DN7487_c2_g1~~TRINITY_DN7487_c2_g1_i2.p1  ORF type:complete len:221 (+),score=41.06 TRINITY_DN7487_c2_g1_i2:83-745(+)